MSGSLVTFSGGSKLFDSKARNRIGFRYGSWLCKNAKALEGDRRNYSSKTVLALKFASAFTSESELRNVILASIFRVFTQPGSKAALPTPKSNFRFTPESGLKTDIWPCPFRANPGLMQRSKWRLFDHLVCRGWQ